MTSRNAGGNRFEETTLTVQDCLAGAFQAILRGDTAERDKLCALAERTFHAYPFNTQPD